jgi:branched-subunit amino acid ABC-type transport system permease component
MLEFVNFYLIPGLILGSIYALGAIGVSMLFGILRFAHFAHGDVMTLGGYLALTFVWWLGWPVLAAIPLAMIGTALVAVGLDRAFYRPFRRRPTIISVIASFGVMLMIRSAIQLIWGVESLEYKSGIEQPLVFFDQLRIQERARPHSQRSDSGNSGCGARKVWRA